MKKTFLFFLMFSLSSIIIFSSCSKEEEEDGELPTVLTVGSVSVFTQSAICLGNVTSKGSSTLSAKGVCYSDVPNPTINSNKTDNGTEIGEYSSSIVNLNHNTTYYFKAYATNDEGTNYGEQMTFKTSL